MFVAKTKALISFAVTAKRICVFVCACAKTCFLMTLLIIYKEGIQYCNVYFFFNISP